MLIPGCRPVAQAGRTHAPTSTAFLVNFTVTACSRNTYAAHAKWANAFGEKREPLTPQAAFWVATRRFMVAKVADHRVQQEESLGS